MHARTGRAKHPAASCDAACMSRSTCLSNLKSDGEIDERDMDRAELHSLDKPL
jgi:hypothetical protein